MKHFIDINCDLGEGKFISHCKHDAQIMAYISRCNIACGGHAGSLRSIRLSLQNAQSHDIQAGAHPGYQDSENFGRLSQSLPWFRLRDMLEPQIQLISDIAAQENIILHHIKLHGALYNDTERNPQQADHIAHWVSQHHSHLTVIGLAGGCLEKACAKWNQSFIREGFMDRRYLKNGQLSPRILPDSVINTPEDAISQAMALALGENIPTLDGGILNIPVDTICLHGDNPHSLELASALHQRLQESGFTLC